jgi:hypothetical protein
VDRQALNVGFWDAEDGAERAPVRDYLCSKISTKDVEEFCRRYHYTGTGGNMMWRYGLWEGPTLLGVVSYNLPTRETCESVFGPEHFDKVWHMGRLAMADDAPRNSESRLIALSLRMIQAQHPDTWGILTYAATDVGHIGYVYQATNALTAGGVQRAAMWWDGASTNLILNGTPTAGAAGTPAATDRLQVGSYDSTAVTNEPGIYTLICYDPSPSRCR